MLERSMLLAVCCMLLTSWPPVMAWGSPSAIAPLSIVAASRAVDGAARASTPPRMTAEEEEALRQEYERYVAAVESPLHTVDEATAQLTKPVRLRRLLSKEDIAAVHRAAASIAARDADSTIDRSAWGQPKGTWLVTFLNTKGAFEAELPELYARIRAAVVAVDAEHWNVTKDVEYVNYRVAEYHTMHSQLDGQPTSGGLHTKRHCDHGSLITIDILLSDLADIEGGVLQTLEVGDELRSHAWEQGDALVFLSHKYHSVSKLTRGTRNVMVCELWQGTENASPTRDEKERWMGAWKDDGWRVSAGAAAQESICGADTQP